jgi:hypothetical protein
MRLRLPARDAVLPARTASDRPATVSFRTTGRTDTATVAGGRRRADID